MKVYVVLVEDHRTDIAVELFTDKQTAINYAENEAYDLCRDEPDEELTVDMERDGWVYNARCSEEGDYVSVREVELDKFG